MTDSETRDATLNTPHGDEIELTADAAGDGFMFRSSRTVLPGDYVLELGAAGDRIPFHVSRDPQESDLSALTTADHELLSDLSSLGRNPTSTMIAGPNQTDPIWPMLLMGLIALIVAELLLSGVIARERFGNDPIAETTEQAGVAGFFTRPANDPAGGEVGQPRVKSQDYAEAGRRNA